MRAFGMAALILWAGLAAAGAQEAATRPTAAEVGALVEAARETAKATRESVEYNRAVPDILTQILAKLDKLEDKLDKVESAVKSSRRR